jgi:hypothetical protein
MKTTEKRWLAVLLSTLLLLGGSQAAADTGCYWQFNEQAAELCPSEHGNVTYLGPDPNYYYGPTLYKEGYGLCGKAELPAGPWDFGPTEDWWTPGTDTTELGSSGSTVLFSRAFLLSPDEFVFSQLVTRDMGKMEVRITMTITNIGSSGWELSLVRFVARAPSGSVSLAARTEQSVLVFEEGSGHGVALTDVTWPPHPDTSTELVSPDSENPCSFEPALGNRAGGVIKYARITLPPGASRTFTVRYRGF